MTPYRQLKRKALWIVGDGRIRCAVPDCQARGMELMHVDHINNDGCEHRRKTKKAGGVHIYRWVVNHPEEARKRLQLLCANHDRLKQWLGSIEAIEEYERDLRDNEYSRYWQAHEAGEAGESKQPN